MLQMGSVRQFVKVGVYFYESVLHVSHPHSLRCVAPLMAIQRRSYAARAEQQAKSA